MKKIRPEVVEAARKILALLKKGKRTSEYLYKKIGGSTYSALSWLALQDLITTGPMDYERAMKRLEALKFEAWGICEDTKAKPKKYKPVLYFLSNRGKEVVELLEQNEV